MGLHVRFFRPGVWNRVTLSSRHPGTAVRPEYGLEVKKNVTPSRFRLLHQAQE